MATGGRAETEELLLTAVLLDGLIDRIQRAPLMRRPPVQCSPEEQVELARILADLAVLRQARAGSGTLPPVRLSLCSAYWPELAALLVPPRSGGPGRAKAREIVPERDAPSLFDVEAASPADTAPVEPIPAPVDDSRPAPATGVEITELLVQALTETGRALNTTQMLAWLDTHGVKMTRETVIDTLFRHEDRFRRRGNSQWTVAGQEQPV